MEILSENTHYSQELCAYSYVNAIWIEVQFPIQQSCGNYNSIYNFI